MIKILIDYEEPLYISTREPISPLKATAERWWTLWGEEKIESDLPTFLESEGFVFDMLEDVSDAEANEAYEIKI